MAQIAGLQDLRKQGAPGDIGTFVQPATAVVFQFTFSGTTTIVAMAVGVSGWVLIDQGAVVATVINAALAAVAGADDGEVVVLEGAYTVLATLSVPARVLFRGVGWGTIFNYNAGGNAITITGNNARVRDLKVVITAGAGTALTRPNCIYVTGRKRLEIKNVWLVGDLTVADEADVTLQNGILLTTVTDSRVVESRVEDVHRSGISLDTTANQNEVIRNTFQNSSEGINLYISQYNTLVDNIFTGNQWDILFYAAAYNTAVGNVCQGSNNSGIRLETNSHYNTVSGNTCLGCAVAGILIWASNANTITGNSCIDCVADTGIGIWVYTGDNNTVTGNTCQGNYATGIYLGTDSSATLVTGNTCQGNGAEGIINWASYATITGNTCSGNTNEGIHLTEATDNTVTGNVCTGNGDFGIALVLDCYNNTVSGNTCQGNTKHGIRLSGANNNTITGNSCNENDSGDTGTYDGINIGTSHGNLIMGNMCRANDRWGIYLTSSDYNKVSNNYTEGNTAGSITVANAACDNNQLEFNTVEEGAPVNAGTLTRAYGNYDPSANAFVGDVGAPPF